MQWWIHVSSTVKYRRRSSPELRRKCATPYAEFSTVSYRYSHLADIFVDIFLRKIETDEPWQMPVAATWLFCSSAPYHGFCRKFLARPVDVWNGVQRLRMSDLIHKIIDRFNKYTKTIQLSFYFFGALRLSKSSLTEIIFFVWENTNYLL